MQALRSLPKSQIRGTLTMKGRQLRLHLDNSSHVLAFQIELAAQSTDGKPIIPLLWSDDFIELMPGEHRDLTATLPDGQAAASPTVVVTGWNTNPLALKMKASRQ